MKVELPAVFQEYAAAGGALDFWVFEDVEGDRDTLLKAIESVVPDLSIQVLAGMAERRIDEATFFGNRYDCSARQLLPRQSSYFIEMPGTGGDFARAFTDPPYGLYGCSWTRAVELFYAVRDYLLPARSSPEIIDWAHERLPEASPYFEAGMEWWGVFLFTIYLPSVRRLAVIAGSTTD